MDPHDVLRDTKHADDLCRRQASEATDCDDKAEHLHAALDLVNGPPFTAAEGFSWAHTEGLVSHATIAIDHAAHQLARFALDQGDPEIAGWAADEGILVTRSCEECYRNLMHAGIAAHNPTAVEAAYQRLLATITTDDGPDAAEYLEPETMAIYERARQMRRGLGQVSD